MRKIIASIGCLVLFIVSVAQLPAERSSTVIRFQCGIPPSSVKPLFIIDGIVNDEFDLKEIDPNNIESIEILKNAAAQTFFCSWPNRGVIVITTKTANQKTIYVKDFLTGEPLPGASIDVISNTNKKDTIHLIADSYGKIVSNNFNNGTEFELSVSNSGYKSLRTGINSKHINSSYTVYLASEYKTLEEVTVRANNVKANASEGLNKNRFVSHNAGLQGYLRCLIAGIKIKMLPEQKEKGIQPVNFKVYPNPVLRSQKMNIEFTSESEARLNIRLYTMEGKLIASNEYMASIGINELQYPIDPRLASGVYAIQIIDQKNKLVKSEKLIIQ